MRKLRSFGSFAHVRYIVFSFRVVTLLYIILLEGVHISVGIHRSQPADMISKNIDYRDE